MRACWGQRAGGGFCHGSEVPCLEEEGHVQVNNVNLYRAALL